MLRENFLNKCVKFEFVESLDLKLLGLNEAQQESNPPSKSKVNFAYAKKILHMACKVASRSG